MHKYRLYSWCQQENIISSQAALERPERERFASSWGGRTWQREKHKNTAGLSVSAENDMKGT